MAKKTEKKFKHNTSAVTIAHYILLFLVTGLCISIIAWIMISRNNSQPSNNISQNIIHITKSTPCVQRIEDIVTRMWALNPRAVPEKYCTFATDYINHPFTTRTYGLCQDVAVLCLHLGVAMVMLATAPVDARASDPKQRASVP